ncbi:hypothetical protein OAN61_00675 [bacterium]|nr:hypothetical protein [bacterium]
MLLLVRGGGCAEFQAHQAFKLGLSLAKHDQRHAALRSKSSFGSDEPHRGEQDRATLELWQRWLGSLAEQHGGSTESAAAVLQALAESVLAVPRALHNNASGSWGVDGGRPTSRSAGFGAAYHVRAARWHLAVA